MNIRQYTLLLFLLSITACKSKSTTEAVAEPVSYPQQLAPADVVSDSLLFNIQDKIYSAFIQGIMTGKAAALTAIGDRLDSLLKKNKQNLIVYWKAYVHYYLAIFHLKQNGRKNAEKVIEKGIAILDAMKNKNSEDHALLAMLESFSIQFKSVRAIFISRRIQEHGTLAIAIDSANLRAYYVLGSSNFHTPEKYGGGQEVEKYLLKAIALPEQTIKNPYLPSWGKADSYALLISYYIRKEDWEKAKKYFQKGKKLFPDNYQINQLAAQLVGK